jgi:hypothetical protein
MAVSKRVKRTGVLSAAFLRTHQARLVEIGRYRAERDAFGVVIHWKNPARLARGRTPIPVDLEFIVERDGRNCDPDDHMFLLMARITDGFPQLLRQVPLAVNGIPDPERTSPTVATELRHVGRCSDPEAVLRVERLMSGERPSYNVYLDLSYLEDIAFMRRVRFDFDAYALTVTNVDADSD